MPAPLVAAAAVGGGAAGGAAAGGAVAGGGAAGGSAAGGAGGAANMGSKLGGMPKSPAGPQSPSMPKSPVGPQSPSMPKSPVGPQSPSMPKSPTGPQSSPTPKGSKPSGGKQGQGYNSNKKPFNNKPDQGNKPNRLKKARDFNDTRKKFQNNSDETDTDEESEENEGQRAEKQKNVMQKAQDITDNLKENVKEQVKEKVKQKIREMVIKLLIQASPYIAMGIGILILIILVIFMIYYIKMTLFPGSYGEDSSGYSKSDIKILEKIAGYAKAHPNADAALALSIAYYPHNEELFSGNVLYYIGGSDQNDLEDSEEETAEETTEETATESDTVEEEIEEDDSGEDADGDLNDVNLKVIKKHLDDFNDILQAMDTQGDNFIEYLRTDYFFNNKYYKKIIARRIVNRGTDEDLASAMIEDIYDAKPFLNNYVQNYLGNNDCTVTTQDGGKISFDSSSVSNIYVQLVSNACSSSLKGCTDYVGSELDLKTYVMGVAYAEIGVSSASLDEEIKAQIVAAKSFAISRSEVMGRDVVTKPDGRTVIYMKNSTNDQVYCDIYSGCPANGAANAKAAMPEDQQTRLSSLYDAVSNIYVYDKNSSQTYGAYVSSVSVANQYCKIGSCMFQEQAKELAEQSKDYVSILLQSYSDEGRFALLDISTSSITLGTVNCDSSSLASSSLNGIRSVKPKVNDKFFGSPYNNSVGSAKFQCVWYARSRGMEIIDASTLDDVAKQKAISVLQNLKGYPGAKDFWNKDPLNSTFVSSNDVNKPKAGSLVIWKWPQSGIPRWADGYNYGHIAIIESVNEDGTVTISEGWRKRICPKSNASFFCLGFDYSTWTIDKVKLSSKYEFLGYYYLLEVKN